MARRSPTNVPVTVLAVGIVVVMMFGVGIIHFSGSTPILQLRPILEQEFQVAAFETRFRPGPNPWLEIYVPAEALEQQELHEVALFALAEYRKLAKRTRVRTLKARVKGESSDPWVEVTLGMVKHHGRAEQATPLMLDLVRERGVKEATLEIVGVGRRGVRLEVRGLLRAPRGVKRSQEVVRSLAAELGKLSWVGMAHVTLKAPEGELTHVSGPDAPSLPKQPSPRTSRPVATPSPSPSR